MAAAIGGRVVMAARNANIIPDRRCFLNRRWPDSSNWRPQGHLVASFSSTGSSNPQRKLVLYTKPGCCLCDGLKEKLDLALKLGDTDSLQDVELQTRDILSNPEWERRYQYEIPVLARVLPDGTEMPLNLVLPKKPYRTQSVGEVKPWESKKQDRYWVSQNNQHGMKLSRAYTGIVMILRELSVATIAALAFIFVLSPRAFSHFPL